MDIPLLQQITNSESVDFTGHKVTKYKSLWRSKSCLKDHELYVIKETECLKNTSIDPTISRTLTAERYGGVGISTNGGGVRCGNINNYQLKGIGANYLVGNNNQYSHSYGGLDASNAIAEIINTNTLKKVLPLGAVNIHELIFTGENSAYDTTNNSSCWGVIMVRDICVRPAHFLPAPGFMPKPEYSRFFKSDIARTRNINRKLAASFDNHNQFILFIGEYLANCANQFAFSRVARIMHATLSPSNISIDGKWLDLPLASFLDSSKNYSLASTFYSEPALALNFAIEMLYTYSKYNNILLNPTPLIKYYNEQLFSYSRFHMEFLLALPFSVITISHEKQWNRIADIILKIIMAGKSVLKVRAEVNQCDPIVLLLKGLFLSLTNDAAAQPYLSKLSITNGEKQELISCFNEIAHCGHNSDNSISPNFLSYITASFILAIKRSTLSGLYYLCNLEIEIRDLCNNGNPDDVASFINTYDEQGNWIFEKKIETMATIFNSEKIKISYLIKENKYELIEFFTNKKTTNFENYKDLYTHLKCLGKQYFFIKNFNCMDFLSHLDDVLPHLNFFIAEKSDEFENA